MDYCVVNLIYIVRSIFIRLIREVKAKISFLQNRLMRAAELNYLVKQNGFWGHYKTSRMNGFRKYALFGNIKATVNHEILCAYTTLFYANNIIAILNKLS